MYFKTNYDSILGQLTLAADEDENIIGLWIEGQKYFLSSFSDEVVENSVNNKISIKIL